MKESFLQIIREIPDRSKIDWRTLFPNVLVLFKAGQFGSTRPARPHARIRCQNQVHSWGVLEPSLPEGAEAEMLAEEVWNCFWFFLRWYSCGNWLHPQSHLLISSSIPSRGAQYTHQTTQTHRPPQRTITKPRRPRILPQPPQKAQNLMISLNQPY